MKLANAARLIGRHPRVVNRWYKWYEEFPVPDDVYLPPRHRIDRSKTYYIKTDDIKYLREFSDNIRRGGKWYGFMSEYNALYQWKEPVSKKALENKGLDKQKVRMMKREIDRYD